MSMDDVTINKIEIDIIQVFSDYVVVQEKVTGAIYTVLIAELDSCADSGYNSDTDDNVISLKDRVSVWLLKNKQNQAREEKKKLPPPSKKKVKKPKSLRLLPPK